MIELRQYQQEAVDTFLASQKKRSLIYSPTGSGKTEVAIEIAKDYLADSKRVWFLCNKINLIDQAHDRFLKSEIPHGIAQGKNSRRIYERCLIGTIQTLVNREIPTPDLIIIDEAHGVAGSKRYVNVLKQFNEARVLGLSATPFSVGLGRVVGGLGLLFEELIIAATIQDLISEGFLVDVDIYAPHKFQPNLDGVKIVSGEYDEKQLELILADKTLVDGIVDNWFSMAFGKQTVVFAHSREHAARICDHFLSREVNAAYVDYLTKDEERQSILKQFNDKAVKILCNVNIFSEGWDSPSCECMILARPTRSIVRYIQQAGRILRPYEGKKKALILDHSNTSTRFGYPTDELPLTLDRQVIEASIKGRVARLPAVCMKCGFLKKGFKCQACGHETSPPRTIHEEHGELVHLHKGKFKDFHNESVYNQLAFLCETRGYKKGWAAHKYKDIYGTWPRFPWKPEPPNDHILNYVKHQDIKWAHSSSRKQSFQGGSEQLQP